MNKMMTRASEARRSDRAKLALAQIQPFFRRDNVEKKARILFPNSVVEIMQVLDEYEPESDELRARVQLDALKASDGSVEHLRELIREARQDFREVVIQAENPSIVRLGIPAWVEISEAEDNVNTEQDVQEYLDWVQSE